MPYVTVPARIVLAFRAFADWIGVKNSRVLVLMSVVGVIISIAE